MYDSARDLIDSLASTPDALEGLLAGVDGTSPTGPAAATRAGTSSRWSVTCATPRSALSSACGRCATRTIRSWPGTTRTPGPSSGTTRARTCAGRWRRSRGHRADARGRAAGAPRGRLGARRQPRGTGPDHDPEPHDPHRDPRPAAPGPGRPGASRGAGGVSRSRCRAATGLRCRAATPGDAAAIARIYNDGHRGPARHLRDPARTPADVAAWFDGRHPLVVIEDETASSSPSPRRPRTGPGPATTGSPSSRSTSPVPRAGGVPAGWRWKASWRPRPPRASGSWCHECSSRTTRAAGCCASSASARWASTSVTVASTGAGATS